MRQTASAFVICAVIVALAACSDGSKARSDSAAVADSTRAASSATVVDSASGSSIGGGSSVTPPPVGSTAGTIGETRKVGPRAKADTNIIGRDSVIAGPYKTMDSLGRIKH